MFKFGKRSSLILSKVNPTLEILANRAINRSEVDFGLIGNSGYRTAKEQNKLYKLGRSKLDGYTKKSYHQSGKAIDLIPYINRKYTWASIEAFKQINKAVTASWKEMEVEGITGDFRLVWGGNWRSFRDYPHYELRNKQ